jgi:diguanylate cyclase (GGDEF)-like protein
MNRVPRVERAGDTKVASSRLRLVLFVTVIAASVMLLIGTPAGTQLMAALLGLFEGLAAGGLPFGATFGLVLVGVLLLAVLAFMRRRGKSESVPVRRAFRSQAAQLPRQADPLRQLRGRGAFAAGLEEKLRGHAEEGRQLAVHRLDIDRFRQVNQAVGSDAGDALLVEVSRRLAELAGDPENLARFGDDEFAVIQPETGGAKHADIFAARIQKALEEPIAVGQSELLVTASIGIAVAPEHGPQSARLLASADLALQAAKQAGRGAIRSFAAEMDERVERRRAVEEAIRQSIQANRFALSFQPEYDLGTRRLTGFELQVRLEDPRLGILHEAEFGPVADEIGLLPAIGERAFREACRSAGKWPQHLRLGFNLLPGHLVGGDIARILGDALKANHLSPGRVDLELTEGVVCGGEQGALDQLRRLAGMGFRLVLDHYGSGHGGPHDLWRHGFGAIKVDAALIGRIGAGEGAEQLVGAIVKLGQALRLEVIADGAERVEQVHFLMLNGCRKVAGPLFGPAVAADNVAAIIDKDSRNAAAEDAARQSSAA